MGGELRQEVVLQTGWSQGGVPLYINRLKQEFDDRITMFRLEKKCIYLKIIAECFFTKTVIQKNGTCICERKDSRLIGNNAVK